MKAKIITLLLLVVSFFTVSITYAWMNIESLHETDRFIELDLRDSAGHSLSIEEIEFSASLYIYDHGQSSFVNLPVNQTELFEVNGWIPGKYVDYRVDITNSSSIEQSYSLSLKGLSTSYTGENNIFDYIALSVYRITGLNYYPDLPEINVGEKCLLSEALSSMTVSQFLPILPAAYILHYYSVKMRLSSLKVPKLPSGNLLLRKFS